MKEKFNELILSGGGIKGIYFIGALEKLNTEYPLTHFKYLTGCSTGGITCSLLAIGYSIQEIKEIYFEINLIDYFDIKLTNVLENGGFSKNDKLRNLIKSIFLTKNVDYNYTFQDLYKQKNKILTLNCVNVSTGKLTYMNVHETPTIKILDAVLMTMNIPIIFSLMNHNNQYFTDGAVLDPYPYYYHKNTIKFGMIIVDNDLFNILNDLNLDNIHPNINIFENFYRLFGIIYNNYLKNFYRKKFKNTIYFKIDSQLSMMNIHHEHKLKIFNTGNEKMSIFLKKKYKIHHKYYLLKKYFHLLLFLLR